MRNREVIVFIDFWINIGKFRDYVFNLICIIEKLYLLKEKVDLNILVLV